LNGKVKSRRTLAAVVLATVVLTILLSVPSIIKESAAVSLSKHVMCKGVDKSESSWKPVDVSDTFSTSDERIYVFLQLDNVEARTSLQFMWVAPDGTGTKGHTGTAYDKAYVWIQYYDTFDIKGTDRQVGVWKSEVYVGGTLFSTVSFKLQPSLDLVSKTQSPKEGEPVFPGDTVTITYELKNKGQSTYKDVKFTIKTLPDQVSLLEATSAKEMKPGTTEKFVLKIKFGKEGKYDMKVHLTINGVLIEEGTLEVNVSVPFFQNPLILGGIIVVVVVVVVAAVLLVRRKRPTTAAAPATPAQPAPPTPAPTKYCINCGEIIPGTAKHCGKCGAAQQ